MALATAVRPERSPSPATRPICIQTHDLSVAFGDHVVVDSLSLAVPQGEIFGLIGPSGCGKSTVVRTLVGLLLPTQGEARVLGRDPARFSGRERSQIGYTPQSFNLYPTLTVNENARFVAGLYGLGLRERRRRIRETLTFLELWDARKRLAKDISGGMQRRLALACALLHHPRLLFVDEPTAGLDPFLRNKIWEHLAELRDGGVTILVTTQHIDEATKCDRVGIMREGRLIGMGTPADLRRAALGSDAVDVVADGLTREDVLALWTLDRVNRVQWMTDTLLRISVDDLGEATALIGSELNRRGVSVRSITPYTPTFDDVFLAVVGGA